MAIFKGNFVRNRALTAARQLVKAVDDGAPNIAAVALDVLDHDHAHCVDVRGDDLHIARVRFAAAICELL